MVITSSNSYAGCLKFMRGISENITGKKFGKLLAVKFVFLRDMEYWLFRCECGKEKIIRKNNAVCGYIKSCGCQNRDALLGVYKSRFYNIWRCMNIRVGYSKTRYYKYYGGRGIKCLWKCFEQFRNDMCESYLEHVKQFGEKETTIDRINVNGDYCKENCRWATQIEQQNNKRQHLTIAISELA